MIKVFLPLICIFAFFLMAGEYNCVAGQEQKQELADFSMNLWPVYKDINKLGVYNRINFDNGEALQISLDKIPPGYSLNMSSRISDDCFSKLKSGRKMTISMKYSFSTKSDNFRNVPILSLRASSKDWKNIETILSIWLENSDAKDVVKKLSFNNLKTPKWAQQLDLQIYASPGDGVLLLKDISIVLEEKPPVFFPYGAILSSKYSGAWFYIENKENMNNSGRVRIVINGEGMNYSKRIETTLGESGNVRPPELPGFYWLSVYILTGESIEKEIVPKTLIYIYE